MNLTREIQLGDCPGCGKPNSAFMGCPGFDHDLLCCSKECGKKIGEIISTNKKTKRYKHLKSALYKVQCSIAREETKGLFPNWTKS